MIADVDKDIEALITALYVTRRGTLTARQLAYTDSMTSNVIAR